MVIFNFRLSGGRENIVMRKSAAARGVRRTQEKGTYCRQVRFFLVGGGSIKKNHPVHFDVLEYCEPFYTISEVEG